MAESKRAPSVRLPILLGCGNGMPGKAYKALSRSQPKEKPINKVTEEARYYISILEANDPKRLERIVRSHRAIKNRLHWVLDIAFDEDSNRTRKGHSAANLAVIGHIALNLIKSEKTSKIGIKIKRLKAGWDNDYLLCVIGRGNLSAIALEGGPFIS